MLFNVWVYTLFSDASVLTDLAGVSFHLYMPYPEEYPAADAEVRRPPTRPPHSRESSPGELALERRCVAATD